MKIHIGDRTYPSVSPERAELIHLMELKQQTRHVHTDGLGMKAINELAGRVEVARRAGEEPDEDDALLFLGVMVFLARRCAGEYITFAEACSVPLGQVRVEPEPHELADAEAETEAPPDPTPAAGDELSGSSETNDAASAPAAAPARALAASP